MRYEGGVRPTLVLIAMLAFHSDVFAWEAAGETSTRHRRISVAVGINSFARAIEEDSQQLDRGWKPLRFAEKDAHDFTRAISRYGFEPYEGRTLTGTIATAREIRDTLERLVDETTNHASQSYEIVLYFSSHGFALESGGRRDSFLVAYDTPGTTEFNRDGRVRRTDLDVAARDAVSQEDLMQLFVERLGSNVVRTAIVYDACYVAGGKSPTRGVKGGGAVDRALVIERQRAFAERVRSLDRTTLVLSSVSWGESAAESKRLENAIYTHFFVEALEGGTSLLGDLVLGGLPMSLFAAHQWARVRVAEVRGELQTPSWASPSVNTGLFFLETGHTESAALPPALIIEQPRPMGIKILVAARDLLGLKGSGWEAAPAPRLVPESGIVLPGPGVYRVSVVDEESGRPELETDVAITSGEIRSVNIWRGLQDRPHHSLSAGVGYQAAASGLWGPATGALSHPSLQVRYGLDGWPNRSGRIGLSAEVGRVAADNGVGLRVEQTNVFLVGEYLVGTSTGLLRVAVGPQIGAGLFVRGVTTTVELEKAPAAIAGAIVRLTIPLVLDFDVEVAGTARVMTIGRLNQGLVSVGANVALQYRLPTAIFIGERQ